MKRKFKLEWLNAIKVEVDKLWKVESMQEVSYTTWLSNVVMVKNTNANYRICVNFSDLNRACSKDTYPLPNIEKLLGGASSFVILSFYDAFFKILSNSNVVGRLRENNF